MVREHGLRGLQTRRRTLNEPRSNHVPLHTQLRALGQEPLVIVLNCDVTLLLSSRPPRFNHKLKFMNAITSFVGHPKHQFYLLTNLRVKRLENELFLPNLPVIGLRGLEWPGEPLATFKWDELRQLLANLCDLGGVRVENRGLSLLVHYSTLAPGWQKDIEQYLDELILPRGWECVTDRHTREYRPQRYSKAYVVERLQSSHAGHVVLIGRGFSDEEGFVKLRQLGGTGIKIGVGVTQAHHQARELTEVTQTLKAWGRHVD